MKASSAILAFIMLLLFSCNKSGKKTQSTSSTRETIQKDTAKNEYKPVFGYRFTITGDFDGDGKKEKLIEHFVSGLDNKETNKFYDSLTDYDELVDLTVRKAPYSFAVADSKTVDTLHISPNAQQFGLAYLKNEGDLDGDGGDEVSYVVDRADWSNLNTWHISTFKNGKWQALYSFPIWDWQLPDLPETINQYGLFGIDGKVNGINNDTINKEIEKTFTEYKGLVKKIKTNKIQVTSRNDGAEEETKIVDLKHRVYK